MEEGSECQNPSWNLSHLISNREHEQSEHCSKTFGNSDLVPQWQLTKFHLDGLEQKLPIGEFSLCHTNQDNPEFYYINDSQESYVENEQQKKKVTKLLLYFQGVKENTHSFNKYLQSTYHMPATVLDVRDSILSKTGYLPHPQEVFCPVCREWGETSSFKKKSQNIMITNIEEH